VTSPQSDLTTHDAPELSVIVPRGGKGSVTLLEGAMGRWVLCGALAINASLLGIV